MEISQFLSKAYTAYHATALAVAELQAAGFERLERGEKWSLREGGRYFLTINGSALIAFVVGDAKGGFDLAMSHTDSPCLKVKGNALLDSPEGKRLNVEVYGGPLLYSFLDIPLRVAGRALVKGPHGVGTRLVVSDYLVNIPSLCIHHNPDANKDLNLNPQQDMLPLLGDAEDVYSSLDLRTFWTPTSTWCPPSSPIGAARTGSSSSLRASTT